MKITRVHSFIAGVIITLLIFFIWQGVSRKHAEEKLKQIAVQNEELKQKPKPLIPIFADEIPQIIEPDKKGNVFLKWSKTQHIAKYDVRIFSLDGKLVSHWTTPKTEVSLKKIVPVNKTDKPAKFKIAVIGLPAGEKDGPSSEQRDLLILQLSQNKSTKGLAKKSDKTKIKMIAAPHIESIIVEE